MAQWNKYTPWMPLAARFDLFHSFSRCFFSASCCIRVCVRSAFSICHRAFIFTLRPFGIYSFHKYFYKAFVSARSGSGSCATRVDLSIYNATIPKCINWLTELSFGRVEAGGGTERRRERGEAGNFAVANCHVSIKQYDNMSTTWHNMSVSSSSAARHSNLKYNTIPLPSPAHSAPCRSVGNDSSHYSQLTWRRLRSFGFCSSSLLLPRPFALFPSPLHTKTKSTRVFTALRTNETADNKAGKCCSRKGNK